MGDRPGDGQVELPERDQDLVQLLWDMEMIKQLKARYFRFLDNRDWQALARLFTEDCTFEAAGMVDVRGGDAFVARAADVLAPGVSVHHGHMPEITIEGPGTASGIWSMFDYVEVDHGQTSTGFNGYGHYHETYRKTATDGWLISSWRLTRLRVDRFGSG